MSSPGNEDKHVCTPENSERMLGWSANRGGIAIWPSVNLSNPGTSWSTPADLTTRPTWECADKPERIITDVADIVVSVDREVKRFHVGQTRGSGLMFVVTDAGSRRIRKEVAKAGDGAYHVFDYDDDKNAVIMAPERTISLREWDNEQQT